MQLVCSRTEPEIEKRRMSIEYRDRIGDEIESITNELINHNEQSNTSEFSSTTFTS